MFRTARVAPFAATTVVTLTAISSVGHAADEVSSSKPDTLDEVLIRGERVRSLEQFTPTGSRLGLSAKDTPATLDVITSGTMQTRGFLTVEEAANSMPGVTSGGAPGDLENFHIRGFSDTQITLLHNGIYVGPSDMVNRPQNAFNVESVEILKGPSSVLYGQGAIGGAINVLNKAPSFGPATLDVYGSAGDFGTTALGIGGTTTLTDELAMRADFSRTATNGYVHRTDGDSFDGTVSLLWKPAQGLDVQFSLDVLNDHPSGYWGTPLVPTAFAKHPLTDAVTTTSGYTVDRQMRFVNFNVGDSKISSTQFWPQLLVRWQPGEKWTFENYTYYMHANRQWIDSEAYSFDPDTSLINRDRFFVFHKQEIFGDQFSVSRKDDLFGLSNQLVLGGDFSHLNLTRRRGFPDGDSVDPYNPNPGTFGPLIAFTGTTKWDDYAMFFEDVLNLTEKLKLITGARFDSMSLIRNNYDDTGAYVPATSFRKTYKPLTYRAGLVYTLNDYVNPYISYTTGQDPVGDNIFTVNASQNFSLGHSRQYEVGLKVSTPDKRADMTLAVYDIRRNNVLQAISPDVSVPVGSQKSKGVELSGGMRFTRNWVVNLNVAYNDATYGQFAYVDGNGDLIDASGKRIPNAPKYVSNLWTSYNELFGLPFEVGAGLRHVSERKGDTANKLTLNQYTTLNLYATYRVTQAIDASVRVDNATDKIYALSADINYPSEVLMGRPRYYQFDVRMHF